MVEATEELRTQDVHIQEHRRHLGREVQDIHHGERDPLVGGPHLQESIEIKGLFTNCQHLTMHIDYFLGLQLWPLLIPLNIFYHTVIAIGIIGT